MPRPEEKPPTEGGTALMTELTTFVENSECVNESERIESIVWFFIDKIDDLQEQIDELS